MWRDEACLLDPAKVWEVVQEEIPALIQLLEPLVPSEGKDGGP